MTTTLKVCTSILLGFLCIFNTTNVAAKTIYTHPTVDLFENIHTGADKKRFVENATYFSLNKQALAQIQQQKLETMTLQIPFGASKRLEVELSKANFLSDDFKVTTQSGDIHNTLSYSPSLFYRGAISGVKDAMVTINFFQESVTGVLSLNGENYNLGRYGDIDSETYVIYQERNLNASNPFACAAEDPKELVFTRNDGQANGRSNKTVEVYVEADYALFNANGSSTQKTTEFVTGLFNVVTAIYATDDIAVKLSELKIWTSQDPYPTSSAKAARDAFGNALNGRFDGDVAHLLSNYKVNGTVPNGGSANIDALCDKDKAVGYTNITTDYKSYPTYSWTAYAVTHEIGHNLGSPHTHSCLWPTGPIDNCWCPEGDCGLGDEPASTGGTVMSYCHLNPQWTNDCDLSASNPGIDLSSGFGNLPSALIKSRINSASCLGSDVVIAFQANAAIKDEGCGQGNGAIELTVSYGQSPYTYNWSNGATSKDLNNIKAGNYSVTITDASGKELTLNETVNGSQPFVVDAGADQVIGCKEPIVTLDGSNSPSGFAYEYLWSSLNGRLYGNVRNKTLNVSEPGVYVLTVSNGDTGCVVEDTVRVMEDYATPTISLSAEQLTCDKATAQISMIADNTIVSYVWSGPNGYTSTTANPIVTQSGTYTIEVTGTNGCKVENSIVVTGNNEQPAVTAQAGVITCGATNTSLTATANMPATFIWIGPNHYHATGAEQMVDKPGIYTVKITAENGCTAETSVTVEAENEIPEVTAFGGIIDCGGNSTQLNAIANTTVIYSWVGPNNFQSSAQNPIVNQAGIYTLTATSVNGCKKETSVEVKKETNPPSLVAKGGMIDCQHPKVTFVISTEEENLRYRWTGPNNFASTEQTPTVSIPGTYQVVATKGESCETILEVLVEENYTKPQFEIKGADITCANSMVNLKGLSNDAIQSYTWTNEQGIISNSQEIEVSQAGIYELTATLANGCAASKTFTVEANQEIPALELKADDLTCANPTTILKAVGAENLTYQWTGPQGFRSNEPTPTVALPGVFTVMAENENGCTNTATITVNQTNTSTISFAATEEISCNQAVVMIDATASVLTENVLVEWTTEDGNIIHKVNDLMITVDQAGTYALTVRDLVTECVTIEAITVAAQPTISARIFNENVLSCNQQELMLSAEGGNYSEHTVFTWKTQDGHIISDKTAKEIRVDAPGIYSLFVTDTITGCSDATFTNVESANRPEAILATTEKITCSQPTVTISGANSVINATSSIEWAKNGVLIPNSNGLFLTTDVAGMYSMTITDTVNQCVTTAQMMVEKQEIPKVAVAKLDQDACGKGEGKIELSIETDAAYKIAWSNGDTTKIIENLAAGIYTATVTDAVGCQVVISQSVQGVNPVTLADFSVQSITCHDSENGAIAVDLKGGNFPYDTQWSNGETGLFAGNLQAGTHTLEVMDAKGCVTTFDFPMNAPNPLVAEVKVVHNDVMVDVAGGKPDYTFAWSDGTSEVYGSNFTPGKHFVTIEDANGCTTTETFEVDATTATVEVEKDIEIMAFPNPTTDYFKVKKEMGAFGVVEMAVFSAAGHQVIQKSMESATIDETINTVNWNPGTYFLRVKTVEGMSVNKIQVIKH